MSRPDLLEKIAAAARRCRALQRDYFATRSSHALTAAKVAEADLDRLLASLDAPPAAQVGLFEAAR